MPTLFFTDGNDSYTVTTAGDYSLVFLDGNDTLTIDGGTFTTGVMGEGADAITLQSGDGLIYGDGGNDHFEIYGAGFEARGGADNDSFNIRGGDHLILRGDGGDDRFTWLADVSSVFVRGGEGNDIFNGAGRLVSGSVYGDAGNDTFIGFRNAGGTAPILRGGLGDDVYRAHPTQPANFIENAGEGTDTVEVSRGRNYTLPANIENLNVGDFSGSVTIAATLTGNDLSNVIRGYTNAETINGLGGNDKLYGGDGADTLNGGDGNDILDGQGGDDALAGGSGNDIYYVGSGGVDVVTEAHAAGTDLIRVLAGGFALPNNVENGIIDSAFGGSLLGNAASNTLTGGAGIDFLQGGGGPDELFGAGGNDFLSGGSGKDVLDGGVGDDRMEGGNGDDRYYVDSLDDELTEFSSEGVDTIYLNAPDQDVLNSFVMPDEFENIIVGAVHPHVIYGNGLDNVMRGSTTPDFLTGRGGSDTISGFGGNDSLFGGDWIDTIAGGNGNDFIFGDGGGTISYGGDELTGGSGADSFVYLTVEDSAPFLLRVDQITDFETGMDKVDIRADADANTAGSQGWTLVDSPTGAAGELWIDSSDASNGNFVIFGEDDGDGLPDLMIRLHAPNGFVASDIVI